MYSFVCVFNHIYTRTLKGVYETTSTANLNGSLEKARPVHGSPGLDSDAVQRNRSEQDGMILADEAFCACCPAT